MPGRVAVLEGSGHWVARWECNVCKKLAEYTYLRSRDQAIDVGHTYLGLHDLQNHGA